MPAEAGVSKQYSTGDQSMNSDLQSQLLFRATIIKVTPHNLLSPVTLSTEGMRVNGNLFSETHLCPSAHTFSIGAPRPLFAVYVHVFA